MLTKHIKVLEGRSWTNTNTVERRTCPSRNDVFQCRHIDAHNRDHVCRMRYSIVNEPVSDKPYTKRNPSPPYNNQYEKKHLILTCSHRIYRGCVYRIVTPKYRDYGITRIAPSRSIRNDGRTVRSSRCSRSPCRYDK
jgi:hypothetical protein